MEPKFVLVWPAGMTTWLIYLLTNVRGQLEQGPKDYCASDNFEISCPEQEVILIQRALYGRMTAGRCVSGSYESSLGCYTDVLQHMDNKCSGRGECQMLVANLEGIVTPPCPMDFKSYLQVTHTCVPVAASSLQECLNTDVIRLTRPSGYIAAGIESDMLESYTCRWSVRAKPGQRISFTLFSFKFNYPDGSNQYEMERTEDGMTLPCPLELVIKDNEKTKIINLCTITKREEDIFQSHGHVADLQLAMSRKSDLLPRFLVHYKAFGCPDLETTSPDIWVSRTGDTVKVRCNETNETWFLTCHGDKWNGVMSNCTTGKHGSSDWVGRPRSYHRAWIVFAIIIGVILGLLVGTSLLTFVLMWRRKKKFKSPPNTVMADGTDMEPRPGDVMTMRSMPSYPALLRQEKTIAGDVSEYTHVFEVQPQIVGQDFIQHAHTCRLSNEARAARMNARKEMTSSFCPNRDPNYDAPCLLNEDKPMIIPKDLPLYFDMDLGLVQCPRHATT